MVAGSKKKVVHVHLATNVNLKPQRSWTALMKASQVGDVNIVKMLVGAGASLKVKAKVSLCCACACSS